MLYESKKIVKINKTYLLKYTPIMDLGPVWNISTQIAKRNVIVMNGWLM